MIYDEICRTFSVNLFRIFSAFRDGVAHRGKVDQGCDAGEVLKNDATYRQQLLESILTYIDATFKQQLFESMLTEKQQ